MRIREIIVLGSFAPITIFSLTVTAIISLVVTTVLHAVLPGA